MDIYIQLLLKCASLANLSWDDIAWIKKMVPNVPVLVKGISAIEDVALAKTHGAAGVVLSNHGVRTPLLAKPSQTDHAERLKGRQLDFAPPPIATLVRLRRERPSLLSDPAFEVYLDGGVTRGTEYVLNFNLKFGHISQILLHSVLKAIALGAKGVGIGRTMLYAQACYGEEGVLRACESEFNLAYLSPSHVIDQIHPVHQSSHMRSIEACDC